MMTKLPLFTKTTSQPRSKTDHTKQGRGFKVSCTGVAADDDAKPLILPVTQNLILPKTSLPMQNVDRRNLLLGLGRLYGSVNFTSLPAAFAEPITSPGDISSCMDASTGIRDTQNAIRSKACCPPVSKKRVKDFKFPKERVIRVRPAAHGVTSEYIQKYKAAIKAMRDLPNDHPHSFVQQAKIHCAYCNGGYTQIASGFPQTELQIHNSWLFSPFHRWYLYFYERILGKLINDPTFALPYWNLDNPAGMTLPAFFVEGGRTNSAFDAYRDLNHFPPAILDLDYSGSDRVVSCTEQISINLACMHMQMISNAPNASCFFGGVYQAGDDPIEIDDASVGSIEACKKI